MKRAAVKPFVAAALMILSFPITAAARGNRNTDSVEREIRALDHAEAEALLHKDVAVLEKLWAEDFTVNNPRNSITHGRSEALSLFRRGIIDYSSFDREIETILFHGDTVIVMGKETVTPIGSAPHAGRTVHRRYTHFWMKRNNRWRLTARHANVICE